MVSIYTDGGCSGNPGPGAWAYVIIKEGDQTPPAEEWGGERVTTNNRMELQAVIAALEALPRLFMPETDAAPGARPEKVVVYTDSQYVQKGMTEWLSAWKSKGWKTSSKKTVKNQDLWLRLEAEAARFDIDWVWIKGHAGNKYNERCDALTQSAIMAFSQSMDTR